jgi:hypothetical protein
MIGTVHRVNRHVIKMAVATQPAQAAFAHLFLNCEEIIIAKIKCGMKLGLTTFAVRKNTISYQNMIMDVGVEITAEAVDKNDCPKSGASRGIRTALPNRGFYCPQEDPEQATDNFRFFHVPSDPLRHRQNPLAELNARQNIIDHVGCRLNHAAS